jgi:L-rhamnose mutarotase
MKPGALHATAFMLTIRPGRVEEYKKRHEAIWPEMLDALRRSGIVHYDIHLVEAERRVFGHMLRDRPVDPAAPEDPVTLRWRAHMADVLEMDGDRPARTPLERVFHMTDED